MMVLGIETSTPIASVALVSGAGLRGEITLNIGLTHSEQLLPLVDALLCQARTRLDEVEGIAVAGGPGSFTGLRIGMATAKGLAQGRNIPLVGVPTLLALAHTQEGFNGLVSPVMNARKNEVYTALFRFGPKGAEQLAPYQAASPRKWAEELDRYSETVIMTGDGVEAYINLWAEVLKEKALFPPPVLRTARAATIAWLGRNRFMEGYSDDLYGLKPLYIRPAEAEARLSGFKYLE